jgi:tetratricopeptide (TPR) repeat protein
MKPSLELFKLVKSLSKSEKRFFKLTSALQSGEKNYIKIFDYIDKNGEYEEAALKDFFTDERFIAHLPSEKNHLYTLILKSLRLFYGEQSVNSILQQEIKNIEILFEKALYSECRKIIKKAKKSAVEHEKFFFWIELLAWEKRLIEEAFEEGDFHFDLDQLIEEEDSVLAQLQNYAEYYALYSKINYVFRSGGFSRNDAEKAIVDNIADNHLIKGKKTAISMRATFICYYIKALCAATNRDYEEAMHFFKHVITIIDKHPKLRSDLSKHYLLSHAHLIHCYIDSNDFKSAQSLIDGLPQHANKSGFQSIDVKVRLFSIQTSYQMMLLNNQGLFDKTLEYTKRIEEDYNSFHDKLSKEHRVIFTYHKAYAHFGCGEFKEAMKVLNELINDNESMLRQDYYSFARVLNMFIHYELENQSLLTYHINSTKRYLNKSDRNYLIENYLLESIQKLNKCESKKEKSALFMQMRSDFEQMMLDHKEKVVLDYFDLGLWIKSKIANQPMNVSR